MSIEVTRALDVLDDILTEVGREIKKVNQHSARLVLSDNTEISLSVDQLDALVTLGIGLPLMGKSLVSS